MNEMQDEVQRFFNKNMSMTQEPSQQSKNKEFLNMKNKRRSKKDKTGRNYVCGCGKEYLSYPALYTHIKTKHDSVQPVGTKSHLASHSKRGRPKKQVDTRADETRTLPDKDNAPFLSFLQPLQFRADSLLLPTDFLEKVDLRLIGEYNLDGETDPTAGFPIINFYDNDKPTFHPFHVIINYLKADKAEAIMNSGCCDAVIALFLFSASKISNEKFYLVLGVFFRNLRECLNEQGYDLIKNYFFKNYSEEARSLVPRRKEDRTFCEVEMPEYLPLVSDKFILEYLPKYCPEFDQQLAVDIMYDFCKWLIKKKFTKIRISFNDDDEGEMDNESTDSSPRSVEGENGREYKKLFGEIK